MQSIPPDILLTQLLPLLPISDLVSLSRTSKAYYTLCDSPSLWRRLLQSTFNTPLAAPTSDTGFYKRAYVGMSNSRAYAWGAADHGRLGFQPPATVGIQVSEDVPREVRGRGWVEMVAGGWSFAARTTEGAVWVWGASDTGCRILR